MKSKPLTDKYLRSHGFKTDEVETVQCYWLGKPECRLYIFEGYTTGPEVSYWACVGKFMGAYEAARRCAHFDKRLRTEADLHQLVDALGIKLK